MFSLPQFMLFVAASLALIFTPGPDIIYVMTRGMAQGRKAALAAAAGFALGNFAHIFFAVVGLSALLMASPVAFKAVKLVGAGYLIYLGTRMFQSTSALDLSAQGAVMTGWRVFRQSIVANILNPKVALFFLAFFPQFIRAENGHPQVQMVLLGTVFVVLVLLAFSLVGFFSGWLGLWLRRNARAEAWMGKIAGVILILLGLSLLLP